MRREKLAWVVSVLLLTLLAFQLPGTMAQRDDDYAFIRTLVDIHRQVETNYVEPVDDSKLRQGAIDGMLGELDPYSIYIPPSRQADFDRMLEGSFEGVGIQLNQLPNGQIEVVTPIDGSPAFKAGVMAGDIILKVNGQSIEGLRLAEVINKVKGKLGSQVMLRVRHATGEEADLSMTREEVVVPTVKGYQRSADNGWDYYVSRKPKVAYIRITQFTPDTAQKVRNAIEPLLADGMKALVLDLRFNPGGRLDQAVALVDMFVEKGVIVSTKGRNRPEDVKRASGQNTLPRFPMAVLINEHSASASEIVAGSLLDNNRALVIGTRSYGKGSVQELIPLEGKSGELKLTVAYYYLPSGRLVHRRKDATDWGVEPQIVVPADVAQQQQILKERYEAELMRRPVRASVTQPLSATQPTSEPVDNQLQRAVDTMMALAILQADRQASGDDRQMRAFTPAATSRAAAATRPVVPPARKMAPATRGKVGAPPSLSPATLPTTLGSEPPARSIQP